MKKRLLALMGASVCAGAFCWAAEQKEEAPWQSLFDGETLAGWTDGEGRAVEEGPWVAANGVLTRERAGSGSLFSEKSYRDFEFSFEWKISVNGNSGVKYRLAQLGGKWLGLEYQILDDDGHPDAKNGPIRQSGALYDLKPASGAKELNAVGEWNESRIMVKEGTVSHFLNGKEVLRLTIPSEEWEERLAKSKYRKVKGFGINPRGRLQLQDHHDVVSYRHLKVREF